MTAEQESKPKKQRLLALDVLRGITVVGMIVVNNAGGHDSYHQLQHSAWNGLTLCDLVFPFFLFIVGISTYISLRKFDFKPSWPVIAKILKRAFWILIVGWAIHWIECVCKADFLPFQTLRLTGVLPRIAVCYAAAALIVLFVRYRVIIWLVIVIAIGYGCVLYFGHGFEAEESSVLCRIDRWLLGAAHLYHKSPIDPEGIMGTFPAIAQTLIGVCCGKILLSKESIESRALRLFAIGFIMMAIGFIFSDWLPLNKRIWSPTFLFATCGLAAMMLATLLYFIDIRHEKRWTPFFEIFGVNPLFLYVLSELAAIFISAAGCKPSIYAAICAVIPDPYVASAIYSVAFALVMGACGYPLYKRRIYIKL